MSNFDLIKEQDKTYVANTYGRFDVAIKEGKGAICTDFDGKEYVDFSSGIGVNSLGFCDEGWVKAVTEQYMNQVTVGDKQEYRAKMEENARVAVAQALKGSSQKDSKLFKSKDGRYTAYSAMEMPKKVVEDAVIEVISKDEKTALEFDQFMFKKTFDAEMEKLAAEQAQ